VDEEIKGGIMTKEKSPASTRLGKLVLPEKEAFGEIVSEIRRGVNPCEVSDLILGPFYEMMGMTKERK